MLIEKKSGGGGVGSFTLKYVVFFKIVSVLFLCKIKKR